MCWAIQVDGPCIITVRRSGSVSVRLMTRAEVRNKKNNLILSYEEDTARRQLYTNQKEDAHQNVTMYFQPLELGKNKFLCFKPTSLCVSVAVAA